MSGSGARCYCVFIRLCSGGKILLEEDSWSKDDWH